MGGFGSGGWSRPDGKTTIEECKRLDIHYLHWKELLYAGGSFDLNWSRNGQPIGVFELKLKTLVSF